MTTGIDVSKEHLDWHCAGDGGTVENGPDGWRELAKALGKLKSSRIVLESTGGYELGIAEHLHETGFMVFVVNPRVVRHFARADRRLAKTDSIDALILAEYGERMFEDSWRPFQPEASEARLMLVRRRQLVNMRTMESNRLDTARGAVRKSVDFVIERLDEQIRAIEAELDSMFEADEDLQARCDLLQTIPGVGPVVARTLVLHMPELGSLNRKTAAALAGLAPYNRDSGKWKGARHIAHGRSEVRNMLYAITLPAIRFNPVISRVWKELKARGKGGKTGRVALARRIIVIANAILRDRTEWKP